VTRIAALLVISALGLWLAFPLLGHCLAGPYSEVTPEVRTTIETMITEALSVPSMYAAFPAILGRILLPPVIILVMALVAVWFLRASITTRQRTALVQALVIMGVGFGFAMVQIRAANLMTPAVPMLGGFIVHAFGQLPRSSRLRAPLAIVLLLGLPATVERGVTLVLEPSSATTVASGSADAARPRLACRTAAAMAEVASLPDSVLFNPVNLGPTILVTTGQSVTSAAYHRSPDAFWNGAGALQSVDKLRAALTKSRADYLIFCVGRPGDSEATLLRSLKEDQLPGWLTPDQGDRKLIAVFKVDKAALAAAGAAP
jgi:hypothetical protein